jgi:hypothetical protein
MPSNPPLVADLQVEVATRCAPLLVETGVYLPQADGTLPVIRVGLRLGCKAVMLTLANPLVLQDSDVAVLSSFAIERVEDEAELYALQQGLMQFWRSAQRDMEAFSAQPVSSGWKFELRRAIQVRISELKSICDKPYREPSDPTVVVGSCGETYPSVPSGQQPVEVTPYYTGPAPNSGRYGPWPNGYGYGYGHGGGYGQWGYGWGIGGP